MNVPDYVSPVVAYRAWRLDPRGLMSLNGEFWHPNQKLQAVCRKSIFFRHTPPRRNCSCGIYAAKSLNHLRGIGYADQGVRGEVYLWGTVVEHKLGWRAQFAYPKTLVVPEFLLGRQSLEILIAYGADLFVTGGNRKTIHLCTAIRHPKSDTVCTCCGSEDIVWDGGLDLNQCSRCRAKQNGLGEWVG